MTFRQTPPAPRDGRPGPSTGPAAGAARTVGDQLRRAREERGIDLYRAERDTKIRARHLAALEDGDDANLPGAVYARGFLRNYALYLGLDPDEAVSRWRMERDSTPGEEAGGPVVVPPQPIATPTGGITFTPSLVIGIILATIVVLFAGYIGLQLVRFSQVPAVRLDGAAVVELEPDATTVVVRGSAGPRAVIEVRGVTGELLTTSTAAEDGRWVVELGVGKGRNDFSLTAKDAETGRISDAVPLTVTVPVPGITGPTAAPTRGPERDRTGAGQVFLELNAPGDRRQIDNDVVNVRGRTDADEVTVSVSWLGPAGGGDPGLLAEVPEIPDPVTALVVEDAFDLPLPLAEGRWELTVSVPGTGFLAGGELVRTVDVRLGGVVAVVEASGADPTIAVWSDGEVAVPSLALQDGERAVFRARRTIVIRTSDGLSTLIIMNGSAAAPAGKNTGPAAVILERGKEPRPFE